MKCLDYRPILCQIKAQFHQQPAPIPSKRLVDNAFSGCQTVIDFLFLRTLKIQQFFSEYQKFQKSFFSLFWGHCGNVFTELRLSPQQMFGQTTHSFVVG